MQLLLAVLALCDPGAGKEGARPQDPVSASPRHNSQAEAPAVAPKHKVREDRVYYGDFRRFSKPAVIDAIRIYQEIPAYRKILDREIAKDDPEYWPLLRKASGEFVRSLKAVCDRKDIDLVGELGSVESHEGAVPEITGAVIEQVRGEREKSRELEPEPRRRIARGSRIIAPRIHAPTVHAPRTETSDTRPGRIEPSVIRTSEIRPSNVRHPRGVRPPEVKPPRVIPGRIIPPRTVTSRIVPPRTIPSRIVPPD